MLYSPSLAVMNSVRRSRPPKQTFAVLLWDGDLLDLPARLVEHRNAVSTREVEIAPVVDRHAVRAQFAEQAPIPQRAVWLDVVGVRLVGADVGDVQHLAVRGPDDAVRLVQVGDDAGQRLTIGGKVID